MLCRIERGEVHLLGPGRIIETTWHKLPVRYSTIRLDQYVIMPDHFHGIIRLVGAPFMASASRDGISGPECAQYPRLGEIVRSFKAATCRLIRKSGCDDFGWQRNYYEHVIRNEQDLHDVREYIRNNPLKPMLDAMNRAPTKEM